MLAPRAAIGGRTPALPGPIGAALGLPAGVAAALLTWCLGGHAGVGIVLAAVAGAALASRTSPAGALVAAVQCWAFLDGFVINRFGTLDAGRADLVPFAIVVGAALAAHLITRLAAATRAPRRATHPAVPPITAGATRPSRPGYPGGLIVGARAGRVAHRA